MGIHRNYVNKKTHNSFYGYNFLKNMSIHRNYMNKKTHSFFFIYSYKLKIWVYKGIFLFYVYPYLIIYKYKKFCIHVVLFYTYKLSNMGIHGNENSFFTWDFKVVLNQFLKFKICPKWLHFTLLRCTYIRRKCNLWCGGLCDNSWWLLFLDCCHWGLHLGCCKGAYSLRREVGIAFFIIIFVCVCVFVCVLTMAVLIIDFCNCYSYCCF